MKPLYLYFHTPYCKVRCHFCSFYLVPGIQTRVDSYFESMKNEALGYKDKLKDYEIRTIYAGGGTPSYVEEKYLCDFVNFLKDNFNISKDIEITTEGSPDSLSKEKLIAYKKAGINRLSIGLQAWQNHILKYIGRIHNLETFLDTYKLAGDLGFSNINVDLIYGFPKLTLANWIESLENVANLNPNHISAYSLIIDEESTFGKLKRLGKFEPISETMDRKMFRAAKSILKDHGYAHYEIANFSKPGFEAKHNYEIWRDNEYLGLGASAYSRFNNEHYNNVFSIENYIKLINSKSDARENIEKIDSNDQIVEHILLRLRIKDGINISEFRNRFGKSIFEIFSEQINKLSELKLLKVSKDTIKLTSKGMDLENIVGLEFV